MLNMIWARKIIREKLKEIEPSLRLDSSDMRILQVCSNDLYNYIKWLETKAEAHYLYTGNNEDEQTIKFIRMWVKKWWKKYKQRVKIVLGKVPRNPVIAVKSKQNADKLSVRERQDLEKMAINTLIANGEICFSALLATSAINICLGKTEIKNWSMEAKLNFTSNVLRYCKHLSHVHGPLVFIKPDKKYYYLREFRNDGKPQSL